MFAVIEVGGTQYKVTEGDTIEVNRLPADKGKTVSLDKVLMYAKGSDVRIGQPYLKDIKVSAKVARETKGPKVTAFQFRRRKSSARKTGHRQKLTALNITKIAA